MRVLHFAPHFNMLAPTVVVGGYASSLLRLARGQARAGHDVKIVGFGAQRFRTFESGVTIDVRRSTARPGSPGYVANVLRLVREQSRKPFEVFHSHSGYAAYVALFSPLVAPGVSWAHTLYCPFGSHPLDRTLLAAEAMHARMPLLMATSENVLLSLAPRLRRRAFGSPLRPAVDVRELEGMAGMLPPGGMRLDGRINFLFVGNLQPSKNLLGVLRAIDEAKEVEPDVQLVATLEFERNAKSQYGRDCMSLIRRLEASGNTMLIGLEPRLISIMSRMDATVLPFQDTRGPSDYFMAGLESMAVGTPLVCSGVGGMREVVRDGQNGYFVDPGRTSQLVRVMCDRPWESGFEAVTRRAHDDVLAMFDLDVIAEDHMKAYQSISGS